MKVIKTSTYFKKMQFAFIACLSLLSLSGCVALVAGAAVGAATVAYVDGQYQKNIPYSFAQVTKATKQVLAKDQTVQTKQTDTTFNITAKSKQGDSIEVKIKRLTTNASQVSIRYGVMGDQSASKQLMHQIEQQL